MTVKEFLAVFNSNSITEYQLNGREVLLTELQIWHSNELLEYAHVTALIRRMSETNVRVSVIQTEETFIANTSDIALQLPHGASYIALTLNFITKGGEQND